MSHEIRTPLNSILGFSELLEEDTYEERQLECLQLIRQSGRQLIALINRILDFSKIDSGHIELEAEPLKLKSFFKEIIESHSAQASEKGLALVCTLDPLLPETVRGDSVRIRQILDNLINNAIKFSYQGQIQVRVNANSTSSEHVELSIIVEDQGIGIPPDKIDGIFDRFFQINAHGKKMHSGAGLGLAICRRLVNLMDGAISIDSQEGKGSIFTVTIMLEPWIPKQDDDAENDKIAHPDSKQNESITTTRVLVVEDEVSNQKLIRLFMKGMGITADIVDSGSAAIEQVKCERYDVILMDIQMPGMDGLETTKHIRSQLDKDHQIPIIALTAKAMFGDKELFIDAGMDDYLSKPYSKADLLHVLNRNILRNQRVDKTGMDSYSVSNQSSLPANIL